MVERTEDRPSTKDLERFLGLMREGTPGVHYYALLLGLRSYDLPYLLRSVEQGFSFSVLEHLRRNIALSWDELAHVIAIPQRTLTRRKNEGKFLPDESDRILRASRVYAKALELFEGDAHAASQWLCGGQVGLGGAIPVDLARTELGAREVENLLERLEQGVIA
jgi:putative toxin-antitoxin system antitoxin component (TIGR02293 family)